MGLQGWVCPLSTDACSTGAHGQPSSWREVNIIKWRGSLHRNAMLQQRAMEKGVGLSLIQTFSSLAQMPSLLPGFLHLINAIENEGFHLWELFAVLWINTSFPLGHDVVKQIQLSLSHSLAWTLNLWSSCLNCLFSCNYRPVTFSLRSTLSS